MIERKEIWVLMERMEAEKALVLNPRWISAYENLIDALDRMDATIARSTVQYVASANELQLPDLDAGFPKEV